MEYSVNCGVLWTWLRYLRDKPTDPWSRGGQPMGEQGCELMVNLNKYAYSVRCYRNESLAGIHSLVELQFARLDTSQYIVPCLPALSSLASFTRPEDSRDAR